MKYIAILLLTCCTANFLSGQCPDRKLVWNRILFMRDKSKIPEAAQLTELEISKKLLDGCGQLQDSVQALLLQRMGWLYYRSNNFFNAIQYTLRSIALTDQQKRSPAIDPSMSIKSYNNLFLMYEALNLSADQVTAADSCINKAISLNSGYDFADYYISYQVARFFNIGDYHRCIAYATLGETIAQKLDPGTAIESNHFYFNWKLNALNNLKRTADAEKLLAVKIAAAEKGSLAEKSELPAYYGLYATTLRDQGQPLPAIKFYNKAYGLNFKNKYRQGCAEALNNIGFIYATQRNQQEKALQYFFKAVGYADANESLNIYANIANAYTEIQKHDSALFYFQKGFDQIKPGINEKDLQQQDSMIQVGKIKQYVADLVLDKGTAWLKKYNRSRKIADLENAIRIYETTDLFFDKLRKEQPELQSQLSWKTNYRRLYEHALEACYASRNAEKAFYFFEKSRSILLNDQILQERKMDDAALAKQAQLKKYILELEQNLNRLATNSPDYLNLQQQLLVTKQQQAKLIREVDNEKNVTRKDIAGSSTVSIAEFRKIVLKDDKSLLEIFTGDSAVYVLSITSDSLSFSKLDKKFYDDITSSLISVISNKELLNKNFNVFFASAQKLYQLIFGKSFFHPGSRLIISPDGKNFPFEALVTNNDIRKPEYLLTRHAISYTYSARYLMNSYVTGSNKSTLLGMAPVKYKHMDSLSDLIGSDASLGLIKNRFSTGYSFVFEQATKANFLQHYPDYSIIQLYTHASDNNNTNPVIYFYDTSLNLSDLIADRKLLTQLVVLSACETANGKLYKGEGIFSFNRGFAALGIPAAVSNLWSVDNKSTYRITELFYTYLAEGLPTDIALQKAKIEFINSSASKEKKLPYFWAGPILVGKAEKIGKGNGFPWWTIVLGVGLVAATGFGVVRYRGNKKRIALNRMIINERLN